MKEPVYECQNCGAELERHQQGKVTWCTNCQVAWDKGFSDGMFAQRRLSEAPDLYKMIDIMEALEPFRVRE